MIHEMLDLFGAEQVFDYGDPNVTDRILEFVVGEEPSVLGCIDSKYWNVAHITRIEQKGAKLAVILPIIIKDGAETEAPEKTMDVANSAAWTEEVHTRGVRTRFYLQPVYWLLSVKIASFDFYPLCRWRPHVLATDLTNSGKTMQKNPCFSTKWDRWDR